MPEEGDEAGFNSIDSSRAIAAGLTFRPYAEIVRDTLAWAQTRPADYVLRAGLKPEREQEALAAWHQRTH